MATADNQADHEPTPVRVLLYSSNVLTRDAVKVAVGSGPSMDLPSVEWVECATPAAAQEAVDLRKVDLLILDGEAQPFGGIGLCRQLKNEIYQCPPCLILVGRADDQWLAAWSQADAVVPHPIDPIQMAQRLGDLMREHCAVGR